MADFPDTFVLVYLHPYYRPTDTFEKLFIFLMIGFVKSKFTCHESFTDCRCIACIIMMYPVQWRGIKKMGRAQERKRQLFGMKKGKPECADSGSGIKTIIFTINSNYI